MAVRVDSQNLYTHLSFDIMFDKGYSCNSWKEAIVLWFHLR